MEELASWLVEHPDAFIVTDIKQDNLDGLGHIRKTYPHICRQIIPQIYNFDEYGPAKELGFDNLILTLYATKYEDEALLEFVREHPLLVVTMPIERARTGLPLKLGDMGIFVYTHTVNQTQLVDELKINGVNGFYTDFIEPQTYN